MFIALFFVSTDMSAGSNLQVICNANGTHTVSVAASGGTIARASGGYLYEGSLTFDGEKEPALVLQSNFAQFLFGAKDKPYVATVSLKNVKTQERQVVARTTLLAR